MHGGAARSGAPKGNSNALKDGDFTREAIAKHRELMRVIRNADELLKKLDGSFI
jgi:hypothetical protein